MVSKRIFQGGGDQGEPQIILLLGGPDIALVGAVQGPVIVVGVPDFLSLERGGDKRKLNRDGLAQAIDIRELAGGQVGVDHRGVDRPDHGDPFLHFHRFSLVDVERLNIQAQVVADNGRIQGVQNVHERQGRGAVSLKPLLPGDQEGVHQELRAPLPVPGIGRIHHVRADEQQGRPGDALQVLQAELSEKLHLGYGRHRISSSKKSLGYG